MSFPSRFLCVTLLVGSLTVGCGSGAARPKSSEIAAQTKELVDQSVSQIIASPQQAAADVEILMESLEAHAREYGGPFEDLLATAKSVHSELNGNPDALKIESELGRLSAAANKVVDASK